LMALTSIGSLLLVFRGRRLRATVSRLESQIKGMSEHPQVSA
jgi:hypothetical protein